MKRTIAVLLSLVLMSGACDTLNMAKCDYKYHSISDLTLVGVNPKNPGILGTAKLGEAFLSSEAPLPLTFTLNLDVTNPNKDAASLSGGTYVLFIDGIKMTEGVLPKFQVNAGATAMMPIGMAFDLRTALSGKSSDAIKNLAFNFAGIGDGESKVKVILSPKVVVAGVTLPSPDVPIEFTVGGE
ncbi:hypothetical protein AGMMS4957_01340 [Bacteroidia bacterium]|nr:hypothetical protein AGMMS4957_01340 [Bacteroidia bacterium]